MHAIPALAALALAFIPQVGGSQSSGPAADTEIIATGHDYADRLTVQVKLGEHGPFPFMIDTGSQNTVVSRTLTSKLALVPSSTSKVVGVAGSMSVDTVEIDEINLGRRSYYGITAPVLERVNIGAEGILGLDSLQNQRVLIDFRKNLMAVGDARSLGGDLGFEIVVTARRRSGQLIMTDARVDGILCDVVIDTGSDTTIGNRALQAALSRRGHVTGQVTLHSVTGQDLTADMGGARKLELQGATITSVAIAFSDSPTFAALGLAKKPTLLLGMREMRAFPRVAIDFQSRKVLFALPKAGDPAYFAPQNSTAVPGFLPLPAKAGK
jgi:predicted aspartyl protease